MSLYKKIKNYFWGSKKKNEIIKSKEPEKEKYLCEINFKLLYSNQIDIEIINADISKSSIDDISTIAENCANLMVLLNHGLLKKELINTIKHKKKKNMDNEKITLLCDNILFFHNILQEELKSLRKESGPIIRPLDAFRSID